eukprot:CAMPEP_0171653304 /NCGR_PEP_ID=MMETSP0990-20121206/39471_1 /TAXON_ID=483369 /ORGANISM="non described non described, Strain CCMP2098" /LENGTH=122 /DNA_ID=CAMNT_0012232691 /DNA_START=85 /DNA_END=453 /DNA_ORIENTATION=-
MRFAKCLCPALCATWSAESPKLVLTVASAPKSNSFVTRLSSMPFAAAHASGVRPKKFCWFGLAPLRSSSSATSECPFWIAKLSPPLVSRWLTSLRTTTLESGPASKPVPTAEAFTPLPGDEE